MGKMFDEYLKEYNAAIQPGVSQGQAAVKMEVWISIKWGKDNNINPWDPAYIEKLKELGQVDMRLAAAVAKGTYIITENIKAQGNGD